MSIKLVIIDVIIEPRDVYIDPFKEAISSSKGRAPHQSEAKQHRRREIRREVTRHIIRPPSLYSDIKLALSPGPVILELAKEPVSLQHLQLSCSSWPRTTGNRALALCSYKPSRSMAYSSSSPQKAMGVPEGNACGFSTNSLGTFVLHARHAHCFVRRVLTLSDNTCFL